MTFVFNLISDSPVSLQPLFCEINKIRVLGNLCIPDWKTFLVGMERRGDNDRLGGILNSCENGLDTEFSVHPVYERKGLR